MKTIARWVASALAFLAMARWLPGLKVADLETALVVSLVYGLFVTVAAVALIPLAYTVFVFVPRPLWNLGCLLVVNAAVLFACARVVKGFEVAGMETAAVVVVGLSVVSAVAEKLLE
jgi:putative membrane protein